jgi:hypothetical protein
VASTNTHIFPTLLNKRVAFALAGDGPAEAFRLGEVPGVAVLPQRAAGVKCARSIGAVEGKLRAIC